LNVLDLKLAEMKKLIPNHLVKCHLYGDTYMEDLCDIIVEHDL